MTKQDGWTPVRRGRIYCSPRCGGGCTFEAFNAATDAAAKAAKALGPGWKPRVWENLGWHWRIERGNCLGSRPYATVRGESARKFSAELYAGVMPPPSSGGAGYAMQFFGRGSTPQKALDCAVRNARFAHGLVGRAIEAATEKGA